MDSTWARVNTAYFHEYYTPKTFNPNKAVKTTMPILKTAHRGIPNHFKTEAIIMVAAPMILIVIAFVEASIGQKYYNHVKLTLP